MCELKERLIKRAEKKHARIFPCARKQDFNACFTQVDDRLLFWYNTHDRSTHIVSGKIIEAAPATGFMLPPAA
jgi:hypothetical protein